MKSLLNTTAYAVSITAPVTLIVADGAIASIARNAPSPLTCLRVGAGGETSSVDLDTVWGYDMSWSGATLFDDLGDVTDAGGAAFATIGAAGSFFEEVIINDIAAVTSGDLNDGAVAHRVMRNLEDLSKCYGVRIFAYLPMKKGVTPSPRESGMNLMLIASQRSSAPMIRSARHVLASFSDGEKLFGSMKSNLEPSLTFKSVSLKMRHGIPSIEREYA
jgi:hypothetical protein